MKKELSDLILGAEKLGLNKEDIFQAVEYFENHEWALSFDQVISQLYEYDIKIDQQYYCLVETIGIELKLPPREFSYIKELIIPH